MTLPLELETSVNQLRAKHTALIDAVNNYRTGTIDISKQELLDMADKLVEQLEIEEYTLLGQVARKAGLHPRILQGLREGPGSLFLNGEQGAWYAPSYLSTLFQDAAGTTPVTADGDPVGLMLDKSGNGNHASQAVSANRPVYRTDGTLHWLEFSVNNLLSTGKAVIDGLNYYWVGAHSQVAGSGTAGVVFASSSSSGGSHVLYSDLRSSPKRLARVAYASSGQLYIDRLTKLDEGVREVISAQRSADTAAAWVNSEAHGELSGIPGGAGDLGDLRIGAYAGVSKALNFYGGIVLAYVPDESMRLAAERHLAIKAGVTL